MTRLINKPVGPLRTIIRTTRGTPFPLRDLGVALPTVVHLLSCGHTTEPYIRAGCRLPPLPKKRRCRQCAEMEGEP